MLHIAGSFRFHRRCRRRRRSSCSILPALSFFIGSAVDIIMPSLATLLALFCNPRRRVPCIVGFRRQIHIPISVWVFISQYLCGFRHRIFPSFSYANIFVGSIIVSHVPVMSGQTFKLESTSNTIIKLFPLFSTIKRSVAS